MPIDNSPYQILFHIRIQDLSSGLAAEQNTGVPSTETGDQQDEAQAVVSRDNTPAVVDDEYTIPGQIGYHLD